MKISNPELPVQGSTANNVVANGDITAGSVSTPDLRANAVTLTGVDDTITGAVRALALGSITITTLGGPVLLNATVTIFANADGAGDLEIHASICRAAVGLSDTEYRIHGQGAGVLVGLPQSLTVLDVIAAGTYTYTFTAAVGTGIYSSTQCINFNAVEFRR